MTASTGSAVPPSAAAARADVRTGPARADTPAAGRHPHDQVDESLVDTATLDTADIDEAIRAADARAAAASAASAASGAAVSGAAEGAGAAVAPPDPPALSGAVDQLLRSAVTLQAEDLLRTVGALAQAGRDVREWTGLVERDARDLALLSSCAVAAGSRLPAGLDAGGGDPDRPGSALEGLLASHEALMDVLRQLDGRCADARVRATVRSVLDRREEEAAVLRGLGAGQGVPTDVRLVRGVLPKYQA